MSPPCHVEVCTGADFVVLEDGNMGQMQPQLQAGAVFWEGVSGFLGHPEPKLAQGRPGFTRPQEGPPKEQPGAGPVAAVVLQQLPHLRSALPRMVGVPANPMKMGQPERFPAPLRLHLPCIRKFPSRRTGGTEIHHDPLSTQVDGWKHWRSRHPIWKGKKRLSFS